jgi:hypothetical protein
LLAFIDQPRRAVRALIYALRNPPTASFSAKIWLALGTKGSDALAKVFRAAQPGVALAFELDCERQRCILDVIQELLRCPLCQRGEDAQFVNECVGRGFELAVGNTVGSNAPSQRLADPRPAASA